ncbi:MAG: acyloxyacyl hydrolase [Gammaproteobacteria bacterium]|nr:acyloxyacyl hydrolase [Gammaproteobacteria bacterium]
MSILPEALKVPCRPRLPDKCYSWRQCQRLAPGFSAEPLFSGRKLNPSGIQGESIQDEIHHHEDVKERMKTIVYLLICLLGYNAVATAQAAEKLNAVAIDIGEGNRGIEIYRLGWQRDFSRWLENRWVPLSGYFETSLNYWRGSKRERSGNDIFAIAFSPVFALHLCRDCRYTPYVEAGIGVALLSDTIIDNRDMSSTFQFEDRLGVGIKRGDFDFHVRYMHYSNAGLSQPNDGIDIIIGGLSYKF